MAVLQEQTATGHDFLQRSLAEVDPEIADAINLEIQRQNDTLELIASENHVSRAVLTAMGSVFTNKYAEGYPGKRYYGGCGPTDIVENIAIERAKKLFGAEHANVQPHSGSQANMAVYFAVLKPGDIGRASCRERVEDAEDGGSIKQNRIELCGDEQQE